MSTYSKEYYQATKERRLAQNKKWRDENRELNHMYQERWRREHEGHTYLDTKSGYVIYIGYEHPAANPSGVTRHHRIVLWDKIGPGPHPCYWGCGTLVHWDKKYPQNKDALCVDHLNGVRDDNSPENLAPVCNKCNTSAAATRRKKLVKVECSYSPCERMAHAHGLCKAHHMQQYRGLELRPVREAPRAHRDEVGRVCTDCNEYKTWDNFSLMTNGSPRAKCKSCLSLQSQAARKRRLARGIPCNEDGCSQPVLNKGLCSSHYMKAYLKEVKAGETR